MKAPPLLQTVSQSYEWADQQRKLHVQFEVHTHFVRFVSALYFLSAEEPNSRTYTNEVTEFPNEPNFDKAQKYIRGQMKWDGCCDWSFGEEGCSTHFCGGPAGVTEFMQHCQKIGEECARLLRETPGARWSNR